MDTFKKQIRQKLFANLLIEVCAHSENLIFRDAWCSQERIIRFTTPFFRRLFEGTEPEDGRRHTCGAVMYEALNGTDTLTVQCVLDLTGVPTALRKTAEALMNAADVTPGQGKSDVCLLSWDLTRADGDDNQLLADFKSLLHKEIPRFEQRIKNGMDANAQTLREGKETLSLSKRFERNPKARAACLAAHGTACVVCGMDFGKTFGSEFAGKIEVHHIVPLNEIGAEYIVDPIRDLVPVCPNCHAALHSKKDGVYTVEELKEMMKAPD